MGSESSSASSLAELMMKGILDGARDRHPESAKLLLSWICEGLRADRSLHPDWADFLADALEKVAKDPEHAGAALGLIPKRRRPVTPEKLDRDSKLAYEVRTLNDSGVPLKDSYGSGAFSKVAETYHVSERTVERAWRRQVAFIKRYAKALAEEEAKK